MLLCLRVVLHIRAPLSSIIDITHIPPPLFALAPFSGGHAYICGWVWCFGIYFREKKGEEGGKWMPSGELMSSRGIIRRAHTNAGGAVIFCKLRAQCARVCGVVVEGVIQCQNVCVLSVCDTKCSRPTILET